MLRRFSLNPRRSIIMWAWTRHCVDRRRYGEAMATHPRPVFVRLRDHRVAEEWIRGLGASDPHTP